MTRTGPADVVMSAHDCTASVRLVLARPGCREPGSGWPAGRELTYARVVFPGSELCKRVNRRLAGRSGRLGAVCPPLRPQRVWAARLPYPSCPRSPALVHPLYSYLLRYHTAPLYGWSFDPGRDILCILNSPPRWLQWP